MDEKMDGIKEGWMGGVKEGGNDEWMERWRESKE